mgnify:FL=1|jgi:hypothetical protein
MSKLCKKATLTRTQIPPNSGKKPSLSDFLTHVHRETSSSVQGLAFATNGTWPVLGFDKRSSVETPKLCVRPIEGRDFDEDKVFELRLWVPSLQAQIPADRDVLAHEFRWVNGVGAVELRVTVGTDSSRTSGSKGSGSRGWLHAVQYLEHVPSSRSTANPGMDSTDNESNQSGGRNGVSHMTALEFIQEEEQYGNMAVTDQLFTGEWTK